MPTLLGTDTSGQVTGNATLSFSHTLASGSNRRVFLMIGWDETGETGLAPSSITYGGQTATLVTDGTTNASGNVTSGNQTEARIYEVLEANLPSDGSNTFSVTLDGTPDWLAATVVCVQDTEQASNVGTVAVDLTETGSSLSADIITDTANSLVLWTAEGSTDWGGDYTATGTNETILEVQESSGVAGHASTYQTTTTAGTYSMGATYTNGQGRVVVIGVELRPQTATIHSGAGTANTAAQAQAVGAVNLVYLYATGDGTLASVVNEVNATTNLYQSIDDNPATPTDTDWVNNHLATTASAFFALTDLPSDFATMSAIGVIVRWRGQTFQEAETLYAQLFQSNETTTLSNEMLIATASSNTNFANTSLVTFTGLDTSSGKAVWDGARIRLRWA